MTKLSTLAAALTLAALAAGSAANAAAVKPHPFKPASARIESVLQQLGATPAVTPHVPTDTAPKANPTWSWVTRWLFDLGLSGEPDEAPEAIDVMPAPPAAGDAPVTLEQSAPGAPNRFYKLQIGKGHEATIRQHGAGNSATVLQSD